MCLERFCQKAEEDARIMLLDAPARAVGLPLDEALIACLETKVARASSPASSGGVSPPERTPGETPGQLAGGTPALQAKLRHLFAYNDEPRQFTAPEVDALSHVFTSPSLPVSPRNQFLDQP